ncbi:DUF664 domain-containing protein [Streptomyces sp. NPDC055105]|uniref:mycothiol transferase n=1 Tax=Streptomyces sp. NPDC055105 TaxID=3365719 RepID=UPI0037CF60E7
MLPSGWSCLGLAQHLDLDVERFWFRAVITGDPSVIEALDDIDDAWQVAPDVPHTEVLDRYRTEVNLPNAAVAATAVDTSLAWWPFGSSRVRAARRGPKADPARSTAHVRAASTTSSPTGRASRSRCR